MDLRSKNIAAQKWIRKSQTLKSQWYQNVVEHKKTPREYELCNQNARWYWIITKLNIQEPTLNIEMWKWLAEKARCKSVSKIRGTFQAKCGRITRWTMHDASADISAAYWYSFCTSCVPFGHTRIQEKKLCWATTFPHFLWLKCTIQERILSWVVNTEVIFSILQRTREYSTRYIYRKTNITVAIAR